MLFYCKWENRLITQTDCYTRQTVQYGYGLPGTCILIHDRRIVPVRNGGGRNIHKCIYFHYTFYTVFTPQQKCTLTVLVKCILLRPGRGAEYCDQFVRLFVCLCVCVCLPANIYLESLDRSSRNFFVQIPVAVARSSSGGVAIRYVLLVLRMTSCLAVMG